MVDKVGGERGFEADIRRFERRLAGIGIQHEDIRLPNMLWSQENNVVMFIDFERSTEIRRRALQEISDKKEAKPGNRVKTKGSEVGADGCRIHRTLKTKALFRRCSEWYRIA